MKKYASIKKQLPDYSLLSAMILSGLLLISKRNLLSALLFLVLISCKKQSALLEPEPQESLSANRSLLPVCGSLLLESSLTSSGWRKTFEDNFDSLNTAKWSFKNQAPYNNELAYYQASNIAVQGGKLLINAKAQATGIYNYTSGRMESTQAFSPGLFVPKVRIYARIKLPAEYGMWSAFWTYNDPWPTKGEIDILEARGQEPYQYQTNYFYGSAVPKDEDTVYSTQSLSSCYHIYMVEWTKFALSFYLDGVLVNTKAWYEATPGILDLFGKPHRIVLNLAVGGNFFNYISPSFNPALIRPGTMYVDWVKVFATSSLVAVPK